MLNNDDDLFINMVNELDSWNGYADGYRAYPMDELDELNSGVSLHDFLESLTGDFNIRDDYFYYSIYGLESTDDIAGLYRDHTDAGEVLDNVIEYYNHLYFSDSEFENLVDEIINYSDDDEETESATA